MTRNDQQTAGNKAGSIVVVNKRDTPPEGYTVVYVGRPSVLGNPYLIPQYSRQEAIEAYAVRLRVLATTSRPLLALAELVERVAAGERLALQCWCAPLACHADVIKREIEARLEGCHDTE